MVAMLLLITIAAASPGAQAVALSGPQPGHPTGCHHHGPAIPAPANTSYQCCVNGHHQAIQSTSFSLRPLVARFCGLDAGEGISLGSVLCKHSAVMTVPSNSPPGSAPLRI
jgi:hypothetical protein